MPDAYGDHTRGSMLPDVVEPLLNDSEERQGNRFRQTKRLRIDIEMCCYASLRGPAVGDDWIAAARPRLSMRAVQARTDAANLVDQSADVVPNLFKLRARSLSSFAMDSSWYLIPINS